MPVFQIRKFSTPERALVIAPASLARSLACEVHGRGALCDQTDDLTVAGALVRDHIYDAILVLARAEAQATALLLRLIKLQKCPRVSLILILDAQQAVELGDICLEADEIMSVSLKPARMIDATGLGAQYRSAPDLRLMA